MHGCIMHAVHGWRRFKEFSPFLPITNYNYPGLKHIIGELEISVHRLGHFRTKIWNFLHPVVKQDK